MESVVRMPLVLAAVLLPLLAGGCGGGGPLGPEDVEYHPSLGVDLDEMRRLPNGVYVQTLQVGLGSRTVVVGDRVRVRYTLWLPSGTEVDQGEFTAGTDQLIPGFRSGILGMVVGEIRLIVVPPEEGYGASPPPGIPANAVLVFRAELLEVLDG